MKPKIKSIHFREDERGTRYIEVTFMDNECVCITALAVGGFHRMAATLNCQDKYKKVLDKVCDACLSYLMGDEKETMSYGELAAADICFLWYCHRPNIFINTELYEQAENDFTSHIAHFEDWDA